jgi:hypothetical protein
MRKRTVKTGNISITGREPPPLLIPVIRLPSEFLPLKSQSPAESINFTQERDFLVSGKMIP